MSQGCMNLLLLLDAAVLNAYILYKLSYSTSKMTRAQFQKKVATSLMRNSAESIRKAKATTKTYCSNQLRMHF
jgi:hypothetical protein